MSIRPSRPVLSIVLTALLLVAVAAGPVAAQTGGGQAVVVEEGETVDEVNAFAGSVIVRGTVTGDVSAFAGDVVIAGTVEGDVSAGAGNVVVEEGGVVGGNFQVGAGTVRIDGRIDGDATVGAETITLGENAAIAGSLTYDGDLGGNYDAVAGDITRDPSLGGGGEMFQPVGSIALAFYGFLVNLVLGAILLAAFPAFSRSVADRVATDPLRSGLVGLGVVIAVPIALVLLLITIVGIPISLAGMVAFALLAWVALVYGRFAVGAWLLSLAGADNRWLALVLGLLVGAVLTLVPYVGGLLNAVIFLLGLGALAIALYEEFQRRRSEPAATPVETSESTVD